MSNNDDPSTGMPSPPMGGMPQPPGGMNPGMPPMGFQTFAPPFLGVPPMSTMPGVPMPPPSMYGMPPPAPLGIQAMYPAGQGPLAELPGTRGNNGLMEAPEPEGPEEHEAQQFMRLNDIESVKYLDFWLEAIGNSDKAEEEGLSGEKAVAFLGRASRVSKGQLRRIWDISDHRKEGKLDRAQFFIALRLLALAQRGAELSVGGLRNFSGIQLLPKLEAPPKPKEVEQSSVLPAGKGQTKSGFSWVITKDTASRFDTFFDGLGPNEQGFLDAGHVVPFLTKSGLPRPTLKIVWQLADATKDGLLSRHEFRTAMHVVTSLRNKRITVETLPSTLDASGPNWLRIEGEPLETPPIQQMLPPVGQQEGTNSSHDGVDGDLLSTNLATAMPAPAPISPIGSGPQSQPPAGGPPPPPPPPPPYTDSQSSAFVPNASGLVPPVEKTAELGAEKAALAELEAERAERQRMLELMRQDRSEMERARREMESMRAEIEQMRMDKEKEGGPVGGGEMTSTKAIGDDSGRGNLTSAPAHVSGASLMLAGAPQSDEVSSSNIGMPADGEKKASTGQTKNESQMAVNDDDDDDDDDDDFWGVLGSKPTLSQAGGGNKNGNASQPQTSSTSQGFGGSELDDWVF